MQLLGFRPSGASAFLEVVNVALLLVEALAARGARKQLRKLIEVIAIEFKVVVQVFVAKVVAVVVVVVGQRQLRLDLPDFRFFPANFFEFPFPAAGFFDRSVLLEVRNLLKRSKHPIKLSAGLIFEDKGLHVLRVIELCLITF